MVGRIHPMPSDLSSRGNYREENGVLSSLIDYFDLIQRNPFHPNTNPCGLMNLGLAENMLCEEELAAKMSSLSAWCPSLNHYGDPLGELSFRQELCHFFHDVLQLHDSVQLTPDRMMLTGGAAGGFTVYSYMLADANDAILVPSPYYSYIDHNVSVVTENRVVRCPLLNQNNGKFQLCREIFERGYHQAVNDGLCPRFILLINPSNPLGEIYDADILLPILEFAAEHHLHVVIDEIYALSTFLNCSFRSILNYDSLLPDPSRTHFLWSFSKDFSLNGARVGVMYTGTSEICRLASKVNFLFVPSRNVQFMLQQLISDRSWVRAYIQLNRQRLTQQYAQMKTTLETIAGVKVRRSQAGFFIWMDLRAFMPGEATFADELYLFKQLFVCAGVYILRGEVLGCTEPGWFRLVFSLNKTTMDQALARLQEVLGNYNECDPPS